MCVHVFFQERMTLAFRHGSQKLRLNLELGFPAAGCVRYSHEILLKYMAAFQLFFFSFLNQVTDYLLVELFVTGVFSKSHVVLQHRLVSTHHLFHLV